MVSLSAIEASNASIPNSLPSGLVAVFVGATSGIGEFSMKRFTKYARQPRIYFVGRSQEAGSRITEELKSINADGQYTFIQGDVSLLKVVDSISRQIKDKEQAINLLFLCQGNVVFKTKTDEGLHAAMSLIIHSRVRFAVNLLPLIRQAQGLRRVVTVLAAGKEGDVMIDDIPGWNLPLTSVRGHGASLLTLMMESLAKQAPEVSFIHNFPGAVKSGLLRGAKGFMFSFFRVITNIMPNFLYLSSEECGERQLFFSTSARYPSAQDAASGAGVPLSEGLTVVKGTDGEIGSGAYSIDVNGESTYPYTGDILAKLRKEGTREKAWEHVQKDFQRITGTEAI